MLGFYLNDINLDSKTYNLIENLNKLEGNYSIFYNNYFIPSNKSSYPILPSLYTYNFKYPIVATCLRTAEHLLKNNLRGYFYVYDLEWIHSQDFTKNSHIYRNSKLIARNEEHFNIIKKTWKTPISILEDFNYEKISKITI